MAFDFPASPSVGQVFTPVTGTGYQWNGYAWDRLASSAPPVSAVPTPADNQVAVWTSPTALEGTNNLTFDNANGQLKVYYPGGQGLRIAPQDAGNPQIQISPDQASPLPDVGLLFSSKGTPGITFYTGPSGSANFQYAQVSIAHQINSGLLILSGGEPTSNPNGNICMNTLGPIQINNARFMGPAPTILNAPAQGDSSDKVPTTAWVQAEAGRVPQEGRLTFVDSTHLDFKPYRGNRIKVNGKIYTIPNAGIVGLTNTNTYVNGVSGQTLATGTFYYIYCFLSGGVLTADFRTGGHATSQTAGNEGVEILVNDDTRTLIGMCRTLGGATTFYNSSTDCGVRSWFNTIPFNIAGTLSGGMYTAGAYIAFGPLISFLCWAWEKVTFASNVYMWNDCSIATPGYGANYIGLDGSSGVTPAVAFHSSGNGWTGSTNNYAATQCTEGFHVSQVYGNSINGTSNWAGAFFINSSMG